MLQGNSKVHNALYPFIISLEGHFWKYFLISKKIVSLPENVISAVTFKNIYEIWKEIEGYFSPFLTLFCVFGSVE